MKIDELIEDLENQLKKIHPLPWIFNANSPFYIDIEKPRPSLSKHDYRKPTYWHYDDGIYIATVVNSIPKLIEEIKRLKEIEYMYEKRAVDEK